MKPNKIKIVLINILIFIFLCSILSFFIGNEIFKKNHAFIYTLRDKYIGNIYSNLSNIAIDITKYETEEDTHKYIEFDDYINQYCAQERLLNGLENNYTKNSVIVLGCSYAYGHGLKKEQTFPYLLSKLTQRPVFSFASCGSHIIDSYDKFSDYLTSLGGGEKRKQQK